MPFCTNCGHFLTDGAKFCASCGTSITSASGSERKTVFDGELHKCPSCGERLKAFEATCPACNYELRGAKSSSAVKDLAEKLEHAITENQRIMIIKNFPIPNTREDIFEFMLLASSNFDASYYATHLQEEDISDAWLTKIEQCCQKARLVIENKKDLERIQMLYENVLNQIETTQKKLKKEEKLKNIAPCFPNILIATGWAVSLIALVIISGFKRDNVGFNVFQIFVIMDLVLGSIFLPKVVNCANIIPKITLSIGLIITIIVLIIFSMINTDNVGFNSSQIVLFVSIVGGAIICVKIFKGRKK